MPLIKSASPAVIGKNITQERKSGRPYKQALAIALSVTDRAEKAKTKSLAQREGGK